MAGWWLLTFALLGALLVGNAAWPRRGPALLLPSWLLAFLTTDLAIAHLALQIIVAVACIRAGALETLPGKLALLVMLPSSAGLVLLWLPNRRAGALAHGLADELGLDAVEPVPRGLLLTPFKRRRAGVDMQRDIEFFRAAGRVLTLDLYRSSGAASGAPALVYLHGGGWVMGDKSNQGLPLCNHLAALGWVCCNANYRLSPGATYPDQVVDAKAAVAWLREHASEYGAEPGFIAIAGGSAGGHIAAMTALTPGDAALQPGFADRDASVQAVVTCYAAYDMSNRLGAHNPEFLTKMIGPLVIKAFPDSEPERFRAASPRDHVANARQPWLMIHGECDTLTPAVEARDFAAALRAEADVFQGYAEFPGAQHAFDIYYSPRAIAAVELAARFLTTVYRRTRAEGAGPA